MTRPSRSSASARPRTGPAGGAVPEGLDGPGDPVAGDLLAGRVDVQAGGQVLAHEPADLAPAAEAALVGERRRRDQLGVVGEAGQHGLGVAPPPGGLEGQRGQELRRPGLAVGDQVAEEGRVAVQLGGGAERAGQPGPGQLHHPDHDLLVLPVGGQPPLGQQLVDLLDEPELLVERQVAGQLVAAVGDLGHRRRLAVPAPGVDLDHPELVRPGVDQLPDRRVLGEEAVPVGAVPDPDGAEQGGDGRRGQHHLGGDGLAPAVEGPELAREHVDGPDQQHRPGAVGLGGEAAEVDPPLQHAPELGQGGHRPGVVVGADGREHDQVLQRGRPDHPGVDQLLQRRGGRVVGPEVLQQPAGGRRVVLQQGRPGEQGADRPARGAAHADDLVAGKLLGPEQPLEHPGGEGGVAAAALAGDGHPGSSRIGHRSHATGGGVCSAVRRVTEQGRHGGREVDG